MEKKAGIGGFVIKLILILIAFGFVLSSIVGSGFLGNGTTLGSDVRIQIGQEALTDGMLNRTVQDYLVSTNQTEMTPNQFQMIQNQLIEQMVLAQAYNQFGGAEPSKDSVAYLVTQNPLFQKDGKYSNELYRQYLETHFYTPDQYVNERVLPAIKSQMVMQGVLNSDFILLADSDFLAQLMAQTREIKTATLNLDQVIDVKQIKIATAQMEEYYQAHRDEFNKPAQYQLNYITLGLDQIQEAMPESTISEKAVKDYYEAHLNEFIAPERYNYHIIAVANQDEADKITQALKQGDSFDALAKAHSTHPDLLDLGWFTQEEVAKNYPDYDSLKKAGQYVELKQADGSVYLVELNAVQPQSVAKYDDVDREIRKYLWHEAAVDQYRADVEKLEQFSPAQYGSLDAFAKAIDLPLEVQQTKWSLDDPELFQKPEIQQSLEDGSLVTEESSTHKLSPIIYTDQGAHVYVIQVADYQKARPLTFDEVKAEIQQTLIEQTAQAQFAEKVTQMLNALNQKDKVSELNFDETYSITRQSQYPNPMIVQTAFQLEPSAAQSVYGSALTSKTQATFVALVSVEDPEMSAQERQSLGAQLSILEQQNLLQLLYQNVLSKTPALTGQPQQ